MSFHQKMIVDVTNKQKVSSLITRNFTIIIEYKYKV